MIRSFNCKEHLPYAEVVPDLTTATFNDNQHHQHHSDESIALGSNVKPNQSQLANIAAPTSPKLTKDHQLRNQNHFVETKTTHNCSNGLQDGNYIFRSISREDWSFCGFSGLIFTNSISRSSFARYSGGRVCHFAAASSVMGPIFESSPSNGLPPLHHHLSSRQPPLLC
jgi:hypothetical protein